MYKLSELEPLINSIVPFKAYDIYLFRLLCKYLQEHITESQQIVKKILKKLPSRTSKPDSYVPTTQEILSTLKNLSIVQKYTYYLALSTGLRKCECKYLIENYKSLKVQKQHDFCKIYLQLYRGNKNSYITFIPIDMHAHIVEGNLCSVSSLDAFLKRQGLIPLKYARKWFFTQCLSLGVPESIIDYLQGRSSATIGSRHYLGKEVLAEKEYREKILRFVNKLN